MVLTVLDSQLEGFSLPTFLLPRLTLLEKGKPEVRMGVSSGFSTAALLVPLTFKLFYFSAKACTSLKSYSLVYGADSRLEPTLGFDVAAIDGDVVLFYLKAAGSA